MGIKRLGRALRTMNCMTIMAVVVAVGMISTLPAGARGATPNPASSPSGGAGQDQNDPQCIPQEVESLRTRDSKTVQNANCTYTATFEQYTHYEREPGRWERVDLRFKRHGPNWIADDHDVMVKVAGATVTATDRVTGEGVRWITPGQPTVSGRSATFSSDGLEWSYLTTKPGVKLVARVSAPRGPETYSFPYALVGGAPDFRVDADGNLRSGTITVPRAGALGADGTTYEADEWRLLPGNRVAFDFDDASLPEAAFPYDLDPTTTFEATSSPDTGATFSRRDNGSFTSYPPSCGGSYTTPVCCTSAQINVERTRWTDDLCPSCYRLGNGLVRWDTSALPDGASINRATVELATGGQGGGSHNFRKLTADWYSAWPVDCADHTATAQTSALAGIGLQTLFWNRSPEGYFNFDLDNTAGLSKTGYSGLRFHIDGGQLSSYEQNLFAFYGYGSPSIEPRLIVVYDNAAPTVTSVTDSPDPVTAGSSIDFTVGWMDSNSGDSVKALICKTNSVWTAGRAPMSREPECSGGTWAIGSPVSSSPARASYLTSPADAGTKSYFAFVCDQSTSCSSSMSGSFKVNRPPEVAFNVSPDSGDQSTVFNASLTGTTDPDNDTLSYRIDWGDGTIVDSQESTHSYQPSGTHTVSGRACDSFGACSTSTVTVLVNRPPSAGIVVDPSRGDTRTVFSATVTGSDADGDALTYEINWGDGATTVSQSGTHRYADPGEYVITGRVIDRFGATDEDTAVRTVCVVYTNGVCADTPMRVPTNPCRDLGATCPDDPTYFEIPDQVVTALDDVQRPAFTANGEVLVLSANAEQVYAIEGHRCTDPKPRTDCDQGMRDERFARRVLSLAGKSEDSEDGMGQVPDIILLQEVKMEDSQHITTALNDLGFTFEIANGRKTNDPEIPNNQANVDGKCEAHYPDTERRRRCKRLAWVEGSSAILYNTTTMRSPLRTSHWDAPYWLEDNAACEHSSGEFVAPAAGIDDFDGDGKPDCRLKWARQYSASFNEIALDDEGEPTDRITSLRVAAATVHLVHRQHFEDQIIHADVKNRQVAGLDSHMNTYEEADAKILGGDFNIHKCSNKNRQEAGDYPEPAIPRLPTDGCFEWAWWTTLTDSRDYLEGVFTARSVEDDRLVPQYKDGCDSLAEDRSTCDDAHERTQRIDFVFGSSPLSVADASNDLTCGQIPPEEDQPEFRPNCLDIFNPQRYSDHRLLWGLFGASLI